MKRTAEKVLGIISALLTLLGIFLSFAFAGIMKLFMSDEQMLGEFEAELLADETLNTEEVELVLSLTNTMDKFGTVAAIILIISLVLTIIGLVAIWNNKNAALAGVMFIIAGLFAFVISPTSLMLYVAGILCFARKARPSNTLDEQNDASEYETMRPL